MSWQTLTSKFRFRINNSRAAGQLAASLGQAMRTTSTRALGPILKGETWS